LRVLITGGAGYIGSNLARRLLADGIEVILFDNLSASLPRNILDLAGRVKLVAGDILDLSHLLRVARDNQVQRIVHTAAVVSVPSSMERPLHTAKVNIEGSLNVFETARLSGVDRVVDISSAEAYGAFEQDPAPEEHPLNSTTPYGITKAAVERFGNHYSDHHGIHYVAARISYAYGPGHPRPTLPKPWMQDALAGRRTVMVRGGDQRIDFTCVEDTIEGLRLVLEAAHLDHRAYNIASGRAVTLREAAAVVKQLIPDWEYEIGPGLPEQSPGYVAPLKGSLDITRAARELGYRPKYDLVSGFRKNLESLREEMAAIDR
jgi:nucleoside-diphosphate-sugar epimerase